MGRVFDAGRDPTRRELVAMHEAHQRAEREVAAEPGEVETRDGRLEGGRQDGCVVDGLDARAEVGVEKAEPPDVGVIPGGTDHVVGRDLVGPPVRAVADAVEPNRPPAVSARRMFYPP